MTNRSVEVELLAKVDRYIAGLRNARQATRDLSAEVLRSTKENHANLERVGRAGLIAGGALATGLGFAVKAAADFDKSLSGVRAVANATAGEMDSLRSAALEAGAATIFSASDAANAEAELAKAGVSVSDILGGGLRGSLDLAAAGQLGLADAATIAAQAMNIFHKRGSDVVHIADVLAAGANKSAADVEQLGEALRQGGLVAAQTGLSLEETVATLSAFADNALVGSDAGTALKSMLQRLTPTSGEAASVMRDLGFSAFDAQGDFIGLTGLAGEMKDSFSGLTVEQRNLAMATVFGADAVRGANVLYEQGTSGIRDYTDAVDDFGAAQRMAAIQLDNLAGDLEALQGSIETALIQSGSGANNALRSLTQSATGAVNAFSELPNGVQEGVFALGGVTSAALLAAGAVGTMLPKIRETRVALEGLGVAGKKASAGLGALGKLGVIGAVVVTLAGSIHYLDGKLRELTGDTPAEVDKLTRSLLRLAKGGRPAGEMARVFGKDLVGLRYDLFALNSDKGIVEFARSYSKLSETLGVSTEFSKAREDLQALDEALTSLVEGGLRNEAAQLFRTVVEGANLSDTQIAELRAALDGYSDAQAGARTQSELSALATDEFGSAIGGVSNMSEEAQQALQDMRDALADVAGSFIEPGAAYTDLLDQKETAERESADATAAATKSGKDSWDDYVSSVSVSIDEYLDELEGQVEAQEQWAANLLTLSSRVSAGTLSALEQMGPEGAPLVAQFVDASDKELRRLERLLGKDTEGAMQAVADELIAAQPVLTQVAAIAGQKTAEALARKLAAGKTSVTRIALEYGVALDEAIPSRKETRVWIVGVNKAKSDALELRQFIDATFFKPFQIGNFTMPSGTPGPRSGVTLPSGTQRRASGGAFGAGPLLVGEGGPELLWSHRGGTVSNSAETRRLLSFSSGRVAPAAAQTSVVRVPVAEQNTHQAPVYVDKMEVADYDDFRRQEEQARRLRSSPDYLGART